MVIKEKRKRQRHLRTQPDQSLGISHIVVFPAFLALVGLGVYCRSLNGPFIYDDFTLPFYNPKFPTAVFTAWINGVRPMLMFSYWVCFQLSGRDPLSYHIVNLFLHIANSGAVLLAVRGILAYAGISEWQRGALSVFGFALFLLHPIQTESVAYIAGRSEVLSAFFFLVAFNVFLYRAGSIRWHRSLILLALFGCALATKEHTIMLPILFLLTDAFWSVGSRIATIRGNWRLYVPILCGCLAAAGRIGWVVNASPSAGFKGAGVSWATYALTECRVRRTGATL